MSKRTKLSRLYMYTIYVHNALDFDQYISAVKFTWEPSEQTVVAGCCLKFQGAYYFDYFQ